MVVAGNPDGALAAASEALRLGPESAAPYLALAALAEQRSAPGEALEYLRRAWGMAPADVRVVLRFADLAERTGHSRDARLALERAVQLAPDEPSPLSCPSSRSGPVRAAHNIWRQIPRRIATSLSVMPARPKSRRSLRSVR